MDHGVGGGGHETPDHIYIYTYVHTYIYTSVHLNIYTSIRQYVHTYTYFCMYIYTNIHTYIHTYILFTFTFDAAEDPASASVDEEQALCPALGAMLSIFPPLRNEAPGTNAQKQGLQWLRLVEQDINVTIMLHTSTLLHEPGGDIIIRQHNSSVCIVKGVEIMATVRTDTNVNDGGAQTIPIMVHIHVRIKDRNTNIQIRHKLKPMLHSSGTVMIETKAPYLQSQNLRWHDKCMQSILVPPSIDQLLH